MVSIAKEVLQTGVVVLPGGHDRTTLRHQTQHQPQLRVRSRTANDYALQSHRTSRTLGASW
ncbi:uncharacterized protein PG998_011873 [Apiospora kogelbergensis]|uniref:uncharacterized protein n=1 Tax=Apiospora kogelbergensis TaxID=1337665 RepID=UPI0031303E0F